MKIERKRNSPLCLKKKHSLLCQSLLLFMYSLKVFLFSLLFCILFSYIYYLKNRFTHSLQIISYPDHCYLTIHLGCFSHVITYILLEMSSIELTFPLELNWLISLFSVQFWMQNRPLTHRD